jgi:hypothetical protein
VQLIVGEIALPLAADAVGVDPEVPIGYRRLLAGIAHGGSVEEM